MLSWLPGTQEADTDFDLLQPQVLQALGELSSGQIRTCFPPSLSLTNNKIKQIKRNVTHTHSISTKIDPQGEALII